MRCVYQCLLLVTTVVFGGFIWLARFTIPEAEPEPESEPVMHVAGRGCDESLATNASNMLGYRLTDVVYHPDLVEVMNWTLTHYPDSIAGKYILQGSHGVDAVQEITSSLYPTLRPGSGTVVVHVSDEELPSEAYGGLCPMYPVYPDMMLLTTPSNSTTPGLSDLRAFFRSCGFRVCQYTSLTTDEALVYGSRASFFVPSGGEFSQLIAQIVELNEGTVYSAGAH